MNYTEVKQKQFYSRYLVRRDIKDIVSQLERFTFSQWCEEDYPLQLRQAKKIGLVITKDNLDGFVVGSCVYKLHKNHLTVGHITYNPEFYGLASFIVENFREKIIKQNRKYVNFLVDEMDLWMQLDLKECGLKCVKQRRDKMLVFRMYHEK